MVRAGTDRDRDTARPRGRVGLLRHVRHKLRVFEAAHPMVYPFAAQRAQRLAIGVDAKVIAC